MLKNNNLKIVDDLEYPDHYQYSKKDFYEIVMKAKKYGDKNYYNRKRLFKIKFFGQNKVLFIKSTLKILDEKKLTKTLIDLNETN